MAITADTTGNPYVITGTTATDDTVTDSFVTIQAILWHAADTNGHLCSVTDKDGKQLWKGQMTTTKLDEDIIMPFPLGLDSSNGIHVDDMDSGELYIYIK